jgi:hypothetical protein
MKPDAPETPPPVVHHASCICDSCCANRAAEVRQRVEEIQRGVVGLRYDVEDDTLANASAREMRARIQEARREELRGRYSAFLEHTMGPVYARLGVPRRAQPGTAAAIHARYGRNAKRAS